MAKKNNPYQFDTDFIFKLVGRDGFGPSKAKPTDLQSVAFDRSATYPNATMIWWLYI